MVSELTMTAMVFIGMSIMVSVIIWIAAIVDLIVGPEAFSSFANGDGSRVMPSQTLSGGSSQSRGTCSECGARLESESFMFCLACLDQEPGDD